MESKPGHLTSEFWLGLLAVALPPVLSFMQSAPNPVVSIAGMVLAAVYAALRTNLKLGLTTAQAPAPAAPAPAAAQAPTPAPAPEAK